MFSEFSNKFRINGNNITIFNYDVSYDQETNDRILEIALPFINMHDPSAFVTNCAINIHQLGTQTYRVIGNFQKSDWDQVKIETRALSYVAGKIALSILFPNAKKIFSSCLVVFEEQQKLSLSISKCEYKTAAHHLFLILNEFISISAFLEGGLALTTLSLTFKILNDLCNSYLAYHDSRGRKPEAVANLIHALIKGHEASIKMNSLYLNFFGKNLTQIELEELYYNEICLHNEEKQLDLDSFLKSRGYSSFIENLNFEGKNFSNMLLRHMQFSNCNFSGSQFKKSSLDHVEIINSDLKSSLWMNSKIHRCFFEGCDFLDFAFINSKSNFSSFNLCNLNLSCWNNSSLSFTKFEDSHLSESHFLNTQANFCILSKMKSLTDCFLFDAEKGFSIFGIKPNKTRPVVAMEWDFEWHGIMTPVIYDALKESGAFPLRFEIEEPSIDVELLEKEVTQALSEMNNINHSITSIPQEILKRAKKHSEIEKIIQIARSVIRHSDGLSIPGGADIEPEFYGQSRDPETHTYDSYLRSMMEFALIQAATDHKVPVMGTCRGSQILNVFFGGTLFQDIDGHHGNSFIHLVPGNKFFDWGWENLGFLIPGLSLHHQGCDKMGTELEVIYEYEGIPKLFSSLDELILGSQIHPEIFVRYAEIINKAESMDPDVLSQIYLEMLKLYRDKNKGIYDLFMKRIADFSNKKKEKVIL